jgi:hypothetical protein
LKCTYKIPQTNTFKSISFNSLYWDGHELGATLGATIVG